MSTYSAEDLRQLLDLHRRWLDVEDGGQRASLAGANLAGAYLARANLAGASLARAYLDGAYLAGANLDGANLAGASLAGANLAGANLARANLARAYLAGASLAGQQIRYASCSWTAHGEIGRALTGIATADGLRLQCGCFYGTTDELRDYIARGEERYRASRTIALEFIVARMVEMGVAS